MYKFIISGILCFYSLFSSLAAQNNENAKAQISQRLQEFTETFKQDKTDLLPSFFTQDAQIIKPTRGEQLKGKDEITQFLQKRAQEIKERNLNFTFKPLEITFPAPNQATVDGIVEVADQKGLLERDARQINLLNQNGKWYINEIREIEVAPPPPIYAHLKELEWLLGNWKDKDQDVTITFANRWDKYKNFIIQNFKMDILGSEALEGIQIIGWDPVDKKIISWVFDSDGGYGEGEWSNQNKDWQVTFDYVLSNGDKGTATNIYSNINDKTYTYSSVDRSVNEEPLEDVKPVTVTKENP
jgi:ketosteroid isomerase-like protein